MKKNRITQATKMQICIAVLSILGLTICIAVLFPQVRHMIIHLAESILHKKITLYDSWFKSLLSYAMGGICIILAFDYFTLTADGQIITRSVKQEIAECLAGIDFRSLLWPFLIMSGVYLLGITTIIRANFLYIDDIGRSITGIRGWYNWSRYVAEFSSVLIHGNTNLTDISPLPQLLAILILAISSVILVYVMGNSKITVVRLLGSLPLGLSPFFLESLSFKFDAPYMALSILLSVLPFLFIAYKKTFFFISFISLWFLCMTYQAASGIYLLIVVILCFQQWNSKEKPDKDILSLLWIAALAFCLAMLSFKLFFMKTTEYIYDTDTVATTMHTLSQMIPGILSHIQTYATVIFHDLGTIWKICIAIVCICFVMKSISASSRNKFLSCCMSLLILGVSFVASYGVYLLLTSPLFYPRALLGFGSFLAVVCITVVSDYKKWAIVPVFALNWCFLVFAFSYGNALADQARYGEFRIGILLHDISVLYPDSSKDGMSIQLKNSISFTPSIQNIAKKYPIIERLVPKQLGADTFFDNNYYLDHFNFLNSSKANIPAYSSIDYTDLDLPVVLDTYYHTIQSDGNHLLITLKR